MIRLSAAPRASAIFQWLVPGVPLRSTPGSMLSAAPRAGEVMPSRWSLLPGALFWVTGWEALGVEIAQAVIWSCLALPVVLVDMVRQMGL